MNIIIKKTINVLVILFAAAAVAMLAFAAYLKYWEYKLQKDLCAVTPQLEENLVAELTKQYNKLSNNLNIPKILPNTKWYLDKEAKPYNKDSDWDVCVYFKTSSRSMFCNLYLKKENETYQIVHGKYSIGKNFESEPSINFIFDLNYMGRTKKYKSTHLKIEFDDPDNGIYNKIISESKAYKILEEWYPQRFLPQKDEKSIN